MRAIDANPPATLRGTPFRDVDRKTRRPVAARHEHDGAHGPRIVRIIWGRVDRTEQLVVELDPDRRGAWHHLRARPDHVARARGRAGLNAQASAAPRDR